MFLAPMSRHTLYGVQWNETDGAKALRDMTWQKYPLLTDNDFALLYYGVLLLHCRGLVSLGPAGASAHPCFSKLWVLAPRLFVIFTLYALSKAKLWVSKIVDEHWKYESIIHAFKFLTRTLYIGFVFKPYTPFPTEMCCLYLKL